MSLTGVRDVDIEILLRLEDSELPAVCSVNKYVNEICKSDAFWYRRLINRITKVRDENLKRYPKLGLIEVTGEKIRRMQKFYGFETLKELNNFLNELPPQSLYVDYYYHIGRDKNIDTAYKMNDEIPKWINQEELRYELRRQSSKALYFVDENRIIPYPTLQFSLTPNPTQIQKLQREYYDFYKTLGIVE